MSLLTRALFILCAGLFLCGAPLADEMLPRPAGLEPDVAFWRRGNRSGAALICRETIDRPLHLVADQVHALVMPMSVDHRGALVNCDDLATALKSKPR